MKKTFLLLGIILPLLLTTASAFALEIYKVCEKDKKGCVKLGTHKVPNLPNETIYGEKKSLLKLIIASAKVVPQTIKEGEDYYIAIELEDKSAKVFQMLTKNNIGKRLAIAEGKIFISAPAVMTEIEKNMVLSVSSFMDQKNASKVFDFCKKIISTCTKN